MFVVSVQRCCCIVLYSGSSKTKTRNFCDGRCVGRHSFFVSEEQTRIPVVDFSEQQSVLRNQNSAAFFLLQPSSEIRRWLTAEAVDEAAIAPRAKWKWKKTKITCRNERKTVIHAGKMNQNDLRLQSKYSENINFCHNWGLHKNKSIKERHVVIPVTKRPYNLPNLPKKWSFLTDMSSEIILFLFFEIDHFSLPAA